MKYYHGTTLENYIKIVNEGNLYSSYYNQIGAYISEDFYHAFNFGGIVFVFNESELDKSKFEVDDVNDGIFYKKKIDIANHSILISISLFVQNADLICNLFSHYYTQYKYLLVEIKNGKILSIKGKSDPIK